MTTCDALSLCTTIRARCHFVNIVHYAYFSDSIAMIALCVRNVVGFFFVITCDICNFCRCVAYINSLRLAQSIVLRHAFTYVRFHFVTISPLYVMFRLHLDLFAMITLHVSNFFSDTFWHTTVAVHS